MLIEVSWALVVSLLIILVGFGLGKTILLRFQIRTFSATEEFVLGTGLGLGTLSIEILLLGLLEQLTPLWLGVLLCLNLFIGHKHVLTAVGSIPRIGVVLLHEWRTLTNFERVLIVIIFPIAIMTLIQSMTPPWAYDALMYHLEGPRQFLSSERITSYTNQWWLNFPFGIEMLFTLGMALGNDIVPKILHFSLGCLFLGTAFVFADQQFGNRSGWLSVAILLGIPILPIWGSIANIDYGWAAFEVLTIFAIIKWIDNRSAKWLILGGLYGGFALSTKYLAIGGFFVLIVLIIYCSRRDPHSRIIRYCFTFVTPALLIASPWYLKNWISLGDPVFPFLLGGNQLNIQRMRMLVSSINSFVTFESMADWILLPIRLYSNPELFSEISPSQSQPSLLFALILLYPLVQHLSITSMIVILSLMHILLWVFTLPNLRYLLPTYFLLSLVSTYMLSKLGSIRIRRITLILPLRIFVLFHLLASLFIQIGFFVQNRPYDVITGRETRSEFLGRMIPTFNAVSFVMEHLPPESTLLSTGDGRLYYCGSYCLQNDDQFQWVQLINESSSAEEFEAQMKEVGATHLLISSQDIDYFLKHGPEEKIRAALYTLGGFLNECGHPLYEDQHAQIYKINCSSKP